MSDVSQDPGLGPDLRKPGLDPRAVTPSSPANRSAQFVPVSGPEQETTSATTMLVTAYVVFWLLLLGFVWLTWRRQQRLANRLGQLESQIAKLHTVEQK
jgi:CcmD family protein